MVESKDFKAAEKRRINVCYVVVTNGKGLGGHFRSLRSVADRMRSVATVSIINLGSVLSPVFDRERTHFIPFDGYNYFSAFIALRRLIKEIGPNVIHSYDVGSHFFTRVLSRINRIPLVHTKCGGANPRNYYPYAKSLVLFSKENQEFFSAHSKFMDSHVYLVPNRISKFDCHESKMAEIRSSVGLHEKILLRISRITSYYETSLKQSINLVKELNEKGFECKLIVIGNVEDKSVYERIRLMSDDQVLFYTAEKYTKNAKELIGVADYVIGTGRGFMEAASQRKVLLSPVVGSEVPLLIDESKFFLVFSKNFSERSVDENLDADANMKNIIRSMTDEVYYDELSKFSHSVFEKYFNIDLVVQKLEKVYEEAEPEKGYQVLDYLLNMYLCSSGLIRTRNDEKKTS